MTEKLGRAELELATNDATLDKGLANAETKSKGFLGRVGASLNNVHKSAGWGAVMQGVGLGAGLSGYQMVAGAIAGAIDMAGNMVAAASDLAETQSKVNVVFGESGDVVRELGETSAESLGMSENAALSAAGTYGNLFRAMGLTEEKSADMSTGLVRLAADLASFNNMDPTEVLDKLRAGLSGETEPLRALGVNLTQARIEQEALNSGLWDGTGAISAAAKAQATYALILQDTTLAQGDFARTSDGLANQQRIMDAKLQDLQATIGEKLLPVWVAITGAMVDFIPAVEAMLPVILKLIEIGFIPLTKTIEAIVLVIDVAVTAATDMALNFGDMGNRVHGIADKLGVDFQTVKDIIRDNMIEAGMSFEEAAIAAEEELSGIPAVAEVAAETAMLAVAREVRAGTPKIRLATHEAAVPISDELKEARRKAAEEARAIPGDISRALIQGMDDVESGMTALTDLMENSLSDAAKMARLKGILASDELAAGLLDERADVRAAAQQVKDDAEAQLLLLESGAADAAVNAGTTLAEQLRLQGVKAALAAAAVRIRAAKELVMTREARQVGEDAGDSYVAGLAASLTHGLTVISGKASDLLDVLTYATSPRYTGARKAGEGVMDHFIGGASSRFGRMLALMRGIGRKAMAGMGGMDFGSLVAPAGLAFDGGVIGGRGAPGLDVGRGGAEGGGRRGGDTYHINVEGLMYARNPIELTDDLERLGDVGLLPKRRKPWNG